MKVMILLPNGDIEFRELPENAPYTAYRDIVGGTFCMVPIMSNLPEGVIAIANDDGFTLGLEPNPRASGWLGHENGGLGFVGPIAFLREFGEDWIGLTESDIVTLGAREDALEALR